MGICPTSYADVISISVSLLDSLVSLFLFNQTNLEPKSKVAKGGLAFRRFIGELEKHSRVFALNFVLN